MLEVYNFAPHQWRGSHLLKAGLNYSHTGFTGSDRSQPVRVVRENGTLYQLIQFVGIGLLEQSQNELSLFVHDKWSINKRLMLDLGLRFDRDQIGAENNFAPRLGF